MSKKFKNQAIFFFLLMVTTGICLSLGATSFFMLWGGLEVSLFASIPLIYLSSHNKKKNLSSLVYFFFKVLGSMLMMMGLSFEVFPGLVCLGFLLKMSLFPSFFWLPGFKSESSWLIIFVFSTLQKMILLMFFTQFFSDFFSIFLVVLKNIFSIFFLAKSQHKMKVFLGFSSLADSIYLLVIFLSDSSTGMVAWVVYSLNFFIVCFCLSKISCVNLMSISSKSMVSSSSSFLLLMSIIFLGLIGFPPMPSFFFKLLFFSSMVSVQVGLLSFVLMMLVLAQSIIYTCMCFSLLNTKSSLIFFSKQESLLFFSSSFLLCGLCLM